MNKIIRLREKNQAFYKTDPIPNESVLWNPVESIKNLSPTKQALISYFLIQHKHYKVIRRGQKKLADAIGVSRKTINKAIGELIEEGYLLSNYNHMRVCEYKLSSFCFTTNIRKVLHKIYKTFKWTGLSVFIGISASSQCFTTLVTRNKSNIFSFKYYNNNNPQNSHEPIKKREWPMKNNNISPTSIQHIRKTKWKPSEKEEKPLSQTSREYIKQKAWKPTTWCNPNKKPMDQHQKAEAQKNISKSLFSGLFTYDVLAKLYG